MNDSSYASPGISRTSSSSETASSLLSTSAERDGLNSKVDKLTKDFGDTGAKLTATIGERNGLKSKVDALTSQVGDISAKLQGALTERDCELIQVAAQLNADFIAVSFCRNAEDMNEARRVARAHEDPSTPPPVDGIKWMLWGGLPPTSAPPADVLDRFVGRDVVRATVIAKKAGLIDLMRVFLSHLRFRFDNESEMLLLAHLAVTLGDTQSSVRIGKTALEKGLPA